MERNEDGTLGPNHQAEDTGIELQPDAVFEDGEDAPIERALFGIALTLQELYDQQVEQESILATVVTIIADNAENPHTMAEELRSLLAVPEDN